MSLVSILIVVVLGICLAAALWRLRRRQSQRELAEHSITPDALNRSLSSNKSLLLFDVRLPLDLLANAEIIPGAKRIDPQEILDNPSLLPKDREFVVYCTCPGDKTARTILDRAVALGFNRVKFLRGGLEAWKAQGYPVVPYDKPFHLNTVRE